MVPNIDGLLYPISLPEQPLEFVLHYHAAAGVLANPEPLHICYNGPGTIRQEAVWTVTRTGRTPAGYTTIRPYKAVSDGWLLGIQWSSGFENITVSSQTPVFASLMTGAMASEEQRAVRGRSELNWARSLPDWYVLHLRLLFIYLG